jgi:hypothetical protein
MTLRTFATLAAVSGTIVLGGWGALALAGWTAGDTPQATPVATAPTKASAPVVASVAAARPAATPIAPRVVNQAVDSALLSPQLTRTAFAPEPVAQRAWPPTRAATEREPESTRGIQMNQATSFPAPKKLVPVVAEAPERKKPVHKFSGVLTADEIARIKTALKLTPEQEQNWGEVETTLRAIGKEQIASMKAGKTFALSANASQQLYWKAGPLIMSLREEQKQEVRTVIRSMGLGSVASLI